MFIMRILYFLCFNNDSLIADSFLKYPKILFTAIQLIFETMLDKTHIAVDLNFEPLSPTHYSSRHCGSYFTQPRVTYQHLLTVNAESLIKYF